MTLTTAALATGAELAITLTPRLVTQGQVALLRVAPKKGEVLPEVSGRADDQTLRFFECPADAAARCALVAVDAEMKPGTLDVVVTWGAAEAGAQSKKVPLRVRKARFKESKLTVDPGITSPSPEDLKRIETEREEITAIYAAGVATPLWDNRFELPGKGGITSRFGNRRSFNGEVKSIHRGVDLRAAVGAPIYAANAGQVAFSKETFYAGNMVILDHGAGIFSLYAHMSEFGVKAGDKVKKGDLLGKAGATGRVTGPHLHWGTRVNNTLVDPLQLKGVFDKMITRR